MYGLVLVPSIGRDIFDWRSCVGESGKWKVANGIMTTHGRYWIQRVRDVRTLFWDVLWEGASLELELERLRLAGKYRFV